MMMNIPQRLFPFWSKASPEIPRVPGVNFSSVWLGGFEGIQHLEEQESSKLDADRLHRTEAALAELKDSSQKSPPIDGIQISLGMPRYFESQLDSFPQDTIRKSPRFFSSYWEQGAKPLCMSVLLVGDDTLVPVEAPPADFSEFNDAYFLSEIFGLAGSRMPSKRRLREKAFATIFRHRPCVAFFLDSGGVGELMEEENWPLEMLQAGYEAALYVAAVQLHQEQGIPLPPRDR